MRTCLKGAYLQNDFLDGDIFGGGILFEDLCYCSNENNFKEVEKMIRVSDQIYSYHLSR